MPTPKHEALVELFRRQPLLALKLLRDVAHLELPDFTELRVVSEQISDLKPATYHADLVVVLYKDKPILCIVVEVQLRRSQHKRYSWPIYLVHQRARFRCPVVLLVVCADESVARWCAQPILIGGGCVVRPIVVGPAGVPKVMNARAAIKDPELAVLSAIAHGRSQHPQISAQIAAHALNASARLDDDHAKIYADIIEASLSDAARKALHAMDPAKYKYQSEFAKRYVAEGRAEGEAKGKAEGKAEGEAEGEAKGKAQGRAEGEAKGRAAIVLKLLALKFGKLPAADVKRVQTATVEDLDMWAERVLSATTLAQVWKPKKKR